MSDKRDDKSNAQSLPDWSIIAFTGHRHLESPRLISVAIATLLDELSACGALLGITSCASGADTLFATALAERNIPFELILPFPPEDFRSDFNADEWHQARLLIDAALHVQCERDCRPSGHATVECGEPSFDQTAYMDTAIRTLDGADVLIAVWDGLPARGFGGTAEVVAYAERIQKPLVVIDASSGGITWKRRTNIHRGRGSATTGAIANPRALVERHEASLDTLASAHGPRVRLIVLVCVLLHLGASILGYVKLVFHLDGISGATLLITEAAVMGIALALLFNQNKRYKAWLDSRVEAEVCRSFLATWDIRRHGAPGHQPRPALPGLGRLFTRLRMLRGMDHSPIPPLAKVRETYHADRARHQMRYFRRHKAWTIRRHTRLALFMGTISAAAFGCTLVAIAAALAMNAPRLERLAIFLAAVLPLISTATLLILITQEFSRRAARYSELVASLRPLRRQARAAPTWKSLSHAATRVEEELLQEIIGWQSFLRFTKHLH